MAAVAELEAGLISQRIRAAFSAAKACGTVLGDPRLRADAPEQARAAAVAKSAQAQARAADVLSYLDAARRPDAYTLHELAEALTNRGMPTPAGRRDWRLEQVWRVLATR